MISVICVYNDLEIFKKFIVSSLGKQTAKYELIQIDNTKNEYKSAAEALNIGAMNAKGDYLMFVHQDIKLCSERWLEYVEQELNCTQMIGIVGVAGRSEKYTKTVSNLKHGNPSKFAGEIRLKSIKEVQTVDECLFIIKKDVFEKYKFDEKICKGWHLYAVDLCLTLKKNGYGNYVLPYQVYHLSIGYVKMNRIIIAIKLGCFPLDYYKNLKDIIKKHKKDYSMIFTTCGNWNTFYPILIQRTIIIIYGFVKYVKKFFKTLFIKYY